MPTSGAGAPSTASVKATAAFWKSGVSQPTLLRLTGTGGGQSDPLLSRALLPGPERGASSSARWFGLRSGLTGKSKAEEGRARRRAAKPVGVGEGKERNTGDIAHLETRRVFRLLFAMSRTIFALVSPVTFPRISAAFSLPPAPLRWPLGKFESLRACAHRAGRRHRPSRCPSQPRRLRLQRSRRHWRR